MGSWAHCVYQRHNEPLQVLFLAHSKGDTPSFTVIYSLLMTQCGHFASYGNGAQTTPAAAIHFKCHLPL